MDIKELQSNRLGDDTRNHPWEFARSKVVRKILSNFIKDADNEKIAVDIGCGDIFFITQFSDKYPDYKIIAVDTAFDDFLIDELKGKHNNKNILFYKTFRDIKNTGKVSVIFLLDVIEHIEKDEEFLKELSAQGFVDDNTLFVITVPAFNSLYCKHDKWLGHYRRYSSALLKKTVENAGLKMLEDGYFFTSLLLPRLIQKTFSSLDDKVNVISDEGIGNWNGGKFTSAVYEKILLSDFYFFRFFSFLGIKVGGLSTYGICKIL